MPRGKKKVVEEPAQEVKQIEIPDNSNRDVFIHALSQAGFKPFIEGGVVYVYVAKPRGVEKWNIDTTTKCLKEAHELIEGIKDKTGYRGSYGVTINKPKEE